MAGGSGLPGDNLPPVSGWFDDRAHVCASCGVRCAQGFALRPGVEREMLFCDACARSLRWSMARAMRRGVYTRLSILRENVTPTTL